MAYSGFLYINISFGVESSGVYEAYRKRWLPKWYYDLTPVPVFVDPGAEMPFTYRWARQFFIPHVRSSGLPVHWLRPGSRYHQTAPSPRYPQGRMIWDIRTMYLQDRIPSFPMITSGARCTETHKQNVLGRFRAAMGLAAHGRTPAAQARLGYRDVVLVGIAADEPHRALPSPAKNYEIHYPLIDLGLGRQDCIRLVQSAGLPAPGKSGCSLCPFAPAWSHWWLSQAHPEEFRKNVHLEAVSIRDRLARGEAPNYMLPQYKAPLPEAVQMWHEKNSNATVAEVERWFVDRDAYRVEWKRKQAASTVPVPCYDCTAA